MTGHVGTMHAMETQVPGWVPEGVIHYLAHTELGQPIRALARAAGCHASTILRQVRRIETRRDDPLVDAALRRLGAVHMDTFSSGTDAQQGANQFNAKVEPLPDDTTLTQEALRILRRLCETGAVLAVAAEMDKAVVVRDTGDGATTRTAIVASSIAQAMALKDWIAPANTGRIVRYHITTAGRAALTRLLENPGAMNSEEAGFAEAQTSFVGKLEEWESEALGAEDRPQTGRMRYSLAESPLIALSRRRDNDGNPFLNNKLVAAGEHLREDFELAQMGTQVSEDWNRLLTSAASTEPSAAAHKGDAVSEARARVSAALADLGPGLSDVVMRCCCYLEGLETTEKRLGWSARSGKIVLRIALMRLQKHYEKTTGPGGPMIG